MNSRVGEGAERAVPTHRACSRGHGAHDRLVPQSCPRLRLCPPYGKRASVRLAKLEHELVHRPGRTVDREVARVLGMAQEIALGDEPEAGPPDLAAPHRLLDALERPPPRRPVAAPR